MNDSELSDLETVAMDEPRRINEISELSIGDEIVFSRRSLSDEEIESKRPLRVVDGASKTVRSTHSDSFTGAEPYETRLFAVEARGEWEGARTYCFADAYNTFDGELAGIVDHDNGIMVEIALVAKAETDDEDDVDSTDFNTAREIACDGGIILDEDDDDSDESEIIVAGNGAEILTDGGSDQYTYRAWCNTCSWSRTHNHEKEDWAEHRAEKATRNHKLAHDHDDTDYGRVSEEEMEHRRAEKVVADGGDSA